MVRGLEALAAELNTIEVARLATRVAGLAREDDAALCLVGESRRIVDDKSSARNVDTALDVEERRVGLAGEAECALRLDGEVAGNFKR